MSESEKADLYKKIQSLTQDLQFLAQKRGARARIRSKITSGSSRNSSKSR